MIPFPIACGVMFWNRKIRQHGNIHGDVPSWLHEIRNAKIHIILGNQTGLDWTTTWEMYLKPTRGIMADINHGEPQIIGLFQAIPAGLLQSLVL